MVDNILNTLGWLVEVLAFEFCTGLMVSGLGCTINASFAKNSTKNSIKKSKLSLSKTPRYLGRGMTIYHGFMSIFKWLVDHSLDIILASIAALIFVLIARYIVTLVFHTLQQSKKQKK